MASCGTLTVNAPPDDGDGGDNGDGSEPPQEPDDGGGPGRLLELLPPRVRTFARENPEVVGLGAAGLLALTLAGDSRSPAEVPRRVVSRRPIRGGGSRA